MRRSTIDDDYRYQVEEVLRPVREFAKQQSWQEYRFFVCKFS